MSRIMALDYGLRRIGVALTDPTATIAAPYTTLTRRRGKRPPWPEIQRIINEKEVAEVVIGLPLDLAGEEGEWAGEVRAFAEQLQGRYGLPVHWVDERLSSVQAERVVRNMGLGKSKREEKGRVDQMAATFILRAFLERGQNRDG